MEKISKKIDKEELKKIQIQILDNVANFCEKNNIQYWIDTGTLLGAVRHKGFIPWDDDIDIGMLRNDYDKFIKLYNSSNSRYQLHCYELNDDYYYPFGKVLDTKTILYEPDINGVKISVNIDVFVYDNAPSNLKKVKKMYSKFRRYERLRLHQHFCVNSNSFINNILNKILKLFPENYFVEKIINNSKKYMNKNCTHVGNFTSISQVYCSKEFLKSFIKLEFEGKLYNAPIGYDEWLKAFYGDYMKLPPEEKRVSPHSFVAFYK